MKSPKSEKVEFEPPAVVWLAYKPAGKTTFKLYFEYFLLQMSVSDNRRDPFAWLEFKHSCCKTGELYDARGGVCRSCHRRNAEPPLLSTSVGPRGLATVEEVSGWTELAYSPLAAVVQAAALLHWCEELFRAYWLAEEQYADAEAAVYAAFEACPPGSLTEERYPF